MESITAEAIDGLGSKLDGLDLTDDERAVLDLLFDRAANAGDEVEGFFTYQKITWTVHGGAADRIGAGLGLPTAGGGGGFYDVDTHGFYDIDTEG